MDTHWSQFVPNMSTRHPRTLSSTSSSALLPARRGGPALVGLQGEDDTLRTVCPVLSLDDGSAVWSEGASNTHHIQRVSLALGTPLGSTGHWGAP